MVVVYCKLFKQVNVLFNGRKTLRGDIQDLFVLTYLLIGLQYINVSNVNEMSSPQETLLAGSSKV